MSISPFVSEAWPQSWLKSVISEFGTQPSVSLLNKASMTIQLHCHRLPSDVAEACQQEQHWIIQCLKKLRANRIHLRGLATRDFIKNLRNLRHSDGRLPHYQTPFRESTPTGFRKSSKCSIRCLTVSTVEVSHIQFPPQTVWAGNYFLLFARITSRPTKRPQPHQSPHTLVL